MSPRPVKFKDKPRTFVLANRLLLFWKILDEREPSQIYDRDGLGSGIAEMNQFRKVYLGIPGIFG